MESIGRIAKQCIAYLRRLDQTAHNISNADTPGFKAMHLFQANESSQPEGNESIRSQGLRPFIDCSQGPMERTDNVLDIAIDGGGFFVVQTDNGEAYTRDGRFAVNENGELVTVSGDSVMGMSGKITVRGDALYVSGEGRIVVDGVESDRLKVVDFEDINVLKKGRSGLFFGPEGIRVNAMESPSVKSGYIERSNVEAIREMVEMINIQRTFESYQKTLQTMSEQNKLSTNRIGRLG